MSLSNEDIYLSVPVRLICGPFFEGSYFEGLHESYALNLSQTHTVQEICKNLIEDTP